MYQKDVLLTRVLDFEREPVQTLKQLPGNICFILVARAPEIGVLSVYKRNSTKLTCKFWHFTKLLKVFVQITTLGVK